MANEVTGFLKDLSGFVTRRIMSGPRVHVEESRMAGNMENPALVVTVVVENPQNQNTFVKDFELEMLEPFEGAAVRYEFRDAQREAIAKALPLNIAAFGASESLKVIAHFMEALPATSGNYRARVATIGRSGFRKRYTVFEGTWDWGN